MTAIGIAMVLISLLMMMLTTIVDGRTPFWYAAIGLFLFFGGLVGVAAGAVITLWRVMP